MGILEDLRDGKPCRWTGVCGEMSVVGGCTCGEAADEIEKLREERSRLREYLNRIASIEGGDVTGLWKIMRDHASAALKEGE